MAQHGGGGVRLPAARATRRSHARLEEFGPDTDSYAWAASHPGHAMCAEAVARELVALRKRRAEILRRDGAEASDEYFFAGQNARLAKNAERYYRTQFRGRVESWNIRDERMAETLEALLAHLRQRGQPAKWAPRWERAIGVIYRPDTERWSRYFHARLARQFDAVIHCDETRSIEPLESVAAWDKEEAPETHPSGVRTRRDGRIFSTEEIVMKLKCPELENGGAIPERFSQYEANRSPQLDLADVPAAARSLTPIMDDSDAPSGTFTHWVVFDIDAETSGFRENRVPRDVRLGANSYGRAEYTGPKPPSGEHRYFFQLFAIDTRLQLADGAAREDVAREMQGHIVARAESMGRYATSVVARR